MAEKKFCKVTGGLVLEVCGQFMRDANETDKRIAEVIKDYKATPGMHISCGHLLEGLYFYGHPGGSWTAMKQFPKAFKPNSRTKEGREIKKRLDAIELLTPETLAGRLNLPPFFYDVVDHGHFCTAVGILERDGVFYLEMPKVIPFNLALVEWMDRGPYYTIVDKK